MTLNQAKWAKLHDWFEDYALIDGDYVVGVLESGTNLHADGSVTEYTEHHIFSDFDALYDWAGY